MKYSGNPIRAVFAGFVATMVMTALAYAAPRFGLPQLDFAQLLGRMFGHAQPGTYAWWGGMAVHLLDGTVLFALLYAYALYPLLRGSPTLRGLQWGLLLWLFAEVLVLPMLGPGLFSWRLPQPALAVLAALLGHVVYGLLLGSLAGVQAVWFPGDPTPRELAGSAA